MTKNLMHSRKLRILLVFSAIFGVATVASADSRSSQALPKALGAQAAANAAPAPAGPKAGFPSTPGLDRAREVANQNARFLRNDSNG